MISSTYMKTMDDLLQFHLTDSLTFKDQLNNFKMDWYALQALYNFDPTKIEVITDQLFVLARRAIEIAADIQETDCESVIMFLKRLHETKNAGYSGDDPDAWKNFRECESFSIPAYVGVITRLCDKWARFWIVFNDKEKDQVKESALDTLHDFCAYCVILMCLLGE